MPLDEHKPDEYLSKICGLQVSYYDHLGNAYFSFDLGDKHLKTIVGFNSATSFAEGVKLGKDLNKAEAAI